MKAYKGITLNRGIEIIKNIVAELLNYLLLFSIEYVLIVDFFKLKPDTMALIALSLVPLFYYFAREKCGKFIFFFLMHLLPIMLIMILYNGHMVQKGVLLIITVVMMILSISRRFSAYTWGMDAAMPPAVVGTYLVLYLMDAGQDGGKCAVMLLQSIIAFMTGYFVYYFLKQFLRYVDVNNRTTDHIPVNHIFFSAAGLAFGFTVIGGVATLLTSDRELMEKVGAVIQNAIISLLVFIFSLFPDQKLAQEVEQQHGMQAGISLMGLLGAGEASLFAKIMDVVFTVLSIGVTLLVLVGFSAGIVKLIQVTFRRKQLKLVAEDDGHQDKVESLNRKTKKKEKVELSGWRRWKEAFSPAEKIRRLYRRVLAGTVHDWENEDKSRVIKQATARECLTKLFPDTQAEAMEFAQLYEKARYGAGRCTTEDVKAAKVLADKLK